MTPASYSWINVFLRSGGQVLQIARVQKEDAGKYTCQAVNEAGEDHMHFELEVLGKQVLICTLFSCNYMYAIKCMYLEIIPNHF